MNSMSGIPSELYEDEIVVFLAGRYHTSAEKILLRFLVQEHIESLPEKAMPDFRLEENEMAMLRDLTGELELPADL